MRDAALSLDVVTEGGSTVFRDAINGESSPLRIVVSTNPPPGTKVTLSAARRHQVDEIAVLLADLGHQISTVNIDYGLSSLWSSTVRLLTGLQHDVDSLPSADGLEARTSSTARLARMIPPRSLRASSRHEQRVATSINRVFDHADVVLTPLCASPAPRLKDCPSTGALLSLRAANTSAWLVPWNLIGQPAMSVPTGIDDGLPTAIHLAGRPRDEATLLNIAAQIEIARPQPLWSPSDQR